MIGKTAGSQDILNHSTTQAAGYLLGTTEAESLGWFGITTDGDANRGQVLITDDQGRLTVTILDAVEAVETPYIHNPTGNLLLEGSPDILWRGTLASEGAVSGSHGITLDGDAGHIDTESIAAKEARFTAFIAEVKRAEAGNFILTKSWAEAAEDWIIPPAGQDTDIKAFTFDGLTGFQTIADGDDVAVAYFSAGDPGEPYIIATESHYGSGTSGTGTTIEDQDFDAVAVGNAVADWRDTATGNVQTENDAIYKVVDIGGNHVLQTTEAGNNYHTHYNAAGASALTNYRFTGRIAIGGSAVGIGLTLFSQYGAGGTDEYYRIRRYNSIGTMHVSNHGSPGISGGTTTTSYNPADYPGEYTLFKVEAEDTGTRTEIRAKFWREGDAEPAAWMIDFYDATAGRLTDGTFGFWGMNAADGAQIDDVLVESLATGSGTNTQIVFSKPAEAQVGDYIYVVATTANGTLTTPSGFTAAASATQGTGQARAYYRYSTVSDPATWSITSTTDHEVFVQVHALRNSNGYNSTSYEIDAASSSIDVPALTHGAAGGISLVAVARQDDGQEPYTGPAGWKTDAQSSSTAHAGALFTKIFEPNESTGTNAVASSPASDTILFHTTFYRQATTATAWGIAWGNMTAKIPQPAGLESNEIVYEWTTSSRTSVDAYGVTIFAGATILDYGIYGDSYIEITTLDQAGHPYIDLVVRGTFPDLKTTGDNLKGRIGNLNGLAGYVGMGAVFFGDNGEIAEFSTSGMGLTDVDSAWKSGGEDLITITRANGATIEVVDHGGAEAWETARGYTFRRSGTDFGGITATHLAQEPVDRDVKELQIYLPPTAGKHSRGYYRISAPAGRDAEARFYANTAEMSLTEIGGVGTARRNAHSIVNYIKVGGTYSVVGQTTGTSLSVTETGTIYLHSSRFYKNAGSIIAPGADSTDAVVLETAGGTNMISLDTTNKRIKFFSDRMYLYESTTNTSNYIGFLCYEGAEKSIVLGTYNLGSGNRGSQFYAGRNSSSGYEAAGHYSMAARGGTSYSIWVDNTGKLRVLNTRPTTSTDTAGTIVGTQSSQMATKRIHGPGPTPQAALDLLLAANVYNFTYKADEAGDDEPEHFAGIVTDEIPELGQDRGKLFNPASANGYTIQAIKAIAARVEALEEEQRRWRKAN